MAHKIERNLKSPHKADLYFWPKLLDRVVVAGNFVKESDGTLRKSPRWGVSMNHVARGSDPNAPETEWGREKGDAAHCLWICHFLLGLPRERSVCSS